LKLSTKLTLFVSLSKLAIILVFVLALPFAVDYISSRYTDNVLRQQKKKVLREIKEKGVDYYLDGQESYGSYTLLREEFIALEPAESPVNLDTIATAKRIIEQDTLRYRILSHTFNAGGKRYVLEVARATSVMGQYSRPLQYFAFYALLALLALTVVVDLMVTHKLIQPLKAIISQKLVNQKFPFAARQEPIETSTEDFQYLDHSLILLMDQINEAFEKEREFTANASHELMTPISILQSKIENLMENTEVTDHVHQKLNELMRTLNRLKKIVNSLLLISRIDNEQFSRNDEVSVKPLITDIMEEISHRLEEKQISFSADFKHKIELQNVNADLLFQMFYNLINNAIKYNKPGGSITVRDEYKVDNYSVVIKDTGIGIPEEDLPSIFNRFKKSNLSEAGGYGLGLAIVKSIAGYHHIKLDVASAVGQGTTITVVFAEESVKG
jgi:signal transduction histidine kinase